MSLGGVKPNKKEKSMSKFELIKGTTKPNRYVLTLNLKPNEAEFLRALSKEHGISLQTIVKQFINHGLKDMGERFSLTYSITKN